MAARRGFSLLEMMIVLVVVALVAAGVVLYLEPVPAEALRTRARNELAELRSEVQARALEVPEHHFADLRAARRGLDVPLDPWGEPYLLVHGAPAMLPTTAMPELWARTCRGIGLTEHCLVTGGPDRRIGGEGAEDDLVQVVKLGKATR